MPDRITRVGLENQQSQVVQASQADKAEEKARQKQAVKLFSDFASGSSSFGTMVAGFQSLSESAKAKGKKIDPTPSRASETVGTTSNTKTASQKSSIDTLVGKTSKSKTVVHPAIAGGNPKAIRAALKEGYDLNRTEIDEGLKEARVAVNDPELQDKFKELGIDGSVFDGLITELQTKPDQLLDPTNDPVEQITNDQKKVAEIQMQQLDNPFGSFKSKVDFGNIKAGLPISPEAPNIKDQISKTGLNTNDLIERNPFGNIGVDLGNFLGNLGAKSIGQPTVKEIGQVIPEAPGLPGTPSSENITNIIDGKGFTNLFETIETGPLMSVTPSTIVEEIGVTSSQPGDFIYTRVNGIQELELELKTIKRKISNVNIGWTGTAIDTKYKDAKTYNDLIIQAKELLYVGQGLSLSATPQHERCAWMHYFIRKDGTIERVVTLETFGNTKDFGSFLSLVQDSVKSDLGRIDNILKEGISIIVDAGHAVGESEITKNTYSKRSITDEAWISLDKVLSTIVKTFPYVEGYSHGDDLLKDIAGGVGFSVKDYLKRYSEEEDG
jgi:hypothetical protein